MITIEKWIAKQEQYYRRRTVELIGFIDNTNDEELEVAVIKTFEEVGAKWQKEAFMQYTDCETKKG